jgi:ADP-heptose:LPS heptosyltransferase
MNIILCPGSAENQKFKRWSAIKFNNLALRLISLKFEVSVVLGPEEGYLEDYFLEVNCIKSPSFYELKNIGQSSDLVVCNDSFLLHFFSFINVNVIALYGPTDPSRTLPPNAYMIKSNVPSITRPCWGTKGYGNCDSGRCSCFDGLEIEDVINKVTKLLNHTHTT